MVDIRENQIKMARSKISNELFAKKIGVPQRSVKLNIYVRNSVGVEVPNRNSSQRRISIQTVL